MTKTQALENLRVARKRLIYADTQCWALGRSYAFSKDLIAGYGNERRTAWDAWHRACGELQKAVGLYK